jgi:hypothetical protein
MINIKDAINSIQDEIYSKSACENFFLRYTEEGNIEAVTLVIYMYSMNIEILLWNSENEEREWIGDKNDYEDFKTFLLRKINEVKMSLTELKSIIK